MVRSHDADAAAARGRTTESARNATNASTNDTANGGTTLRSDAAAAMQCATQSPDDVAPSVGHDAIMQSAAASIEPCMACAKPPMAPECIALKSSVENRMTVAARRFMASVSV